MSFSKIWGKNKDAKPKRGHPVYVPADKKGEAISHDSVEHAEEQKNTSRRRKEREEEHNALMEGFDYGGNN